MTRAGASIVLLAFALTTAVGCSDDDVFFAAGPTEITGTFLYTATNAEGQPALTGVVMINASEGSAVVGSWEIDWIPGADTTQVVGPQIGSGDLLGSVGGDHGLSLNLNPNYADNNVFLHGDATGGSINGTWSYSTFIGTVATGSFVLRPLP